MIRSTTSGPSIRRDRGVAALTLCVLACASALTTAARSEAEVHCAGNLQVHDLRTEHATDPLGIDVIRPVLSWKLRARVTDQKQTAFQVQVFGTDRQMLWDTGRTSSNSQEVTYSGPALGSGQRYTWQVRVWDAEGTTSAWSAPACWEMGMLSSADWSGAQWISGPDGAGLPRWPTGTKASASSFHARQSSTFTFEPANAIDGNPGSFWNDDTENVFPDWLTVTTPQPLTLPGVTLFSHVEGGPSDFVVETLHEGEWVTQRRFTGVGQAYTQVTFDAPVTTTAVRIFVLADWEQDTSHIWTRIGELTPGLLAESRYSPAAAPLLRTTFGVDRNVRQARLYISGLAYYEASINGKRVGDSVLDPAFTMYDHRVNYATHDVTGLLVQGRNAIGVELGRGFFGLTTVTPSWNWNKATWHHEPELKAKLVVTYMDGSSTTVTTGDGWLTAAGPRLFDSVYVGEDYDARLEQPGWQLPFFDPVRAGWQAAPVVDAPAGVLRAQTVQPVRVTESFPAKNVSETAAGRLVFDFGRMTAGWVGLNNVSGAAGMKIAMRYGEQLNADGTVMATATFGGRPLATYTYVVKGSGAEESWQPAFSWQSFRYVEVTGLPVTPTTSTLTGHAVHSDVPVVGSFSSSNELFNKIHAAALRTIQNNMQSVLTDTPLFEKNGWMDDGMVGSQFIPLILDVQRFFEKWAVDMQDAQAASGNVPQIVPSNGNGLDINPFGPAPEWQGGYPAVVWSLYQNYGDTRVLSQHYDSLVRYADYELGALDAQGLAVSSLGDWMPPEPSSDNKVTATAYVYRSVRTIADIAVVLNRTDDATKYFKAADAVKAAFNRAFFQSAKGYYQASSESSYRQCTNAHALAFDMVPSGAEQSVADSLSADVAQRGDHLATGSIGTSVLLIALSRHGHVDTAAKIVAQTTYPSWGYWFVNGADTLWEGWWLDVRSRNHLFLGAAPEQWFFEDLAGLRRTGPAWSTLSIDPAYSVGLSSARATIDTVRGPATSDWSIAVNGTATVNVVVPVGSVAEIHLPTAMPSLVTVSGQRLDAICSTPTLSGRPCGRPVGKDASGIRALSLRAGQLVATAGSGTFRFLIREASR